MASDFPTPGFDAIIALGANLGDRRRTLESACRALNAAGLRVVRHSRLYWSRPWGLTDQPDFLNAAVAIRTSRRPLEILHLLQSIERRYGRRRDVRWGPRPLDLDLLLYRNLELDYPCLQLPHPQIQSRDFVLAPLIDLRAAPIPSVAPNGWAALLHALPPSARTLIHSTAWQPVP